MYTYNLARGLSRLGHSVFLVVPSDEQDPLPVLPQGTRVVPVRSTRIPLSRVANFLFGAKKILPALIDRQRIDITHFTFDYPSFPVHFNRAEGPVMATVHHLHFVEAVSVLHHHPRMLITPYLARQFLLTRIERRFAKNMDALIAISDFTRGSLLENGFVGSQVRVIHDGIDTGFFAGRDGSLFRRRFNLADRPYLLYVGRLNISKGIEYLLSAFRTIRNLFPEMLLVVVGRGPPSYVRTLRARSHSATRDGVLFTGYVDPEELRSAYAGSTLLVLPSLMEGLGITLLEGMAAGKACVATRVGGIPEIIEDGETGVLVEPGNATSLAEAITGLLDNPAWGRGIGEQARRVVRKNYSIEVMTEKTLSFYNRIVETTRRGEIT